MNSKRITVFTPTFNRAYIIENLYKSLQQQTFTNFEWLVVDDGSTDNTEQLFQSFINDNNTFVIRYYKQENGGKHRAVNRGLSLANGIIFFVVDSDDMLTVDALEKIDGWFKDIACDTRIKGIIANRGYSAKQTMNDFFSEPYLDKAMLEMGTYTEKGKAVLGGERAIAFYTDFHRKYLYPEFEGEKFVTEAVVYNRMANDGYKMRFYNDIIWIYEYKEDGLTKSGHRLYLNNPRGYCLWLKEQNQFRGKSWLDNLKLYYTISNELYPGHTVLEIADYFNTDRWVIYLCCTVRKIKKAITKKKKL